MRLSVLLALMRPKRLRASFPRRNRLNEYLVEILSPRILGRIVWCGMGLTRKRAAAVSRADARQRFGLPADCPVIGMVAHLIPWKKHDAFIMAATEIRRQRRIAHFVAVGRDLFNEHSRWSLAVEKWLRPQGWKSSFHWIRDCDDAAQILRAFDLLIIREGRTLWTSHL
jgi:glycosyltransferase involved in cell wall biosynthesis